MGGTCCYHHTCKFRCNFPHARWHGFQLGSAGFRCTETPRCLGDRRAGLFVQRNVSKHPAVLGFDMSARRFGQKDAISQSKWMAPCVCFAMHSCGNPPMLIRRAVFRAHKTHGAACFPKITPLGEDRSVGAASEGRQRWSGVGGRGCGRSGGSGSERCGNSGPVRSLATRLAIRSERRWDGSSQLFCGIRLTC